jgi:tetratricopeptide (TPR) repeat protein
MRLGMTMLAAFAATALLVAAPVLADETPPSVSAPGAAPEQAPPKTRAEQLDALFDTLKTTDNKEAARAAEDGIWHLWLQSGSDTVDLLMGWAMKAMEEKDYATALDFLDRVIIMKPDYAEGWNKRATVYFMMDDYAKSIADIGKTLALEPRHFGALSGLGLIMRELGEDKRAIEAYQRALAVDPNLDGVQKALDELQAKAAGKQI